MNEPTLTHFLVLSALLFAIGIYGLLTQRNLIALLMSVEILLNSAALNFVAFHHYRFGGDTAGAAFPLFIIAVAAAEAAVVLAIVIVLFRHHQKAQGVGKLLDVEQALDVEANTTLKH